MEDVEVLVLTQFHGVRNEVNGPSLGVVSLFMMLNVDIK